ncbi:TonB-dependent receptor [Chitinimonas sp. JJ19]|uniref:TonB-dependent receptor n=1 Tax=Chitinimonas sp. JJ19 TaxID=3109352 RepID=UPI003002F5A2
MHPRLTSLSAAMMLASLATSAFAAEQTQTLVVTANRLPAAAADQPVNISVISREDIERSAASNLIALLEGVVGVTVRNSDGTDNGSIDLRGFGITAASNTLILLDGIKLNDNDLSSPKLSGMALDRLERIEIVRGGAVAWGGGSTGGVINLITRQGPGGSVSLRAGSHQSRELFAGAGFGTQLTLRLDGYHQESDGFRRNSAHKTNAGSATLGWQEGDTRLSLGLARDEHENRFAGPRAVNPATGSNEFVTDPWGSSNLADHGDIDNTRYTFHGEGKLGQARWVVDLSRREKDQDSYFEDAYDGISQARNEIRENRFSPRAAYDFGALDLAAGVDISRSVANGSSSYTSPFYNSSGTSTSVQQTRAFWLDGGYAVAVGTRITLGARTERAEQTLHSSGLLTSDRKSSPLALQLGLRHVLSPELSLYARLGKSYRLPNADELAFSSDLRTQTSRDLEAGLDARLPLGKLRVSLFNLRLNDEIAFQPHVNGFGANINLQPTLRRGLEADWSYQAGSLSLGANLAWQDAEFRSGIYAGHNVAGKQVPLVPKLQGNLQVGWAFSEATRLSASLHGVGDSRLDNDQDNTGAKLAGYGTVNLKLSHQLGDLQLALSGQNLADKRYATYGIKSTTASNYNLYPMPGRRWFASAAYHF